MPSRWNTARSCSRSIRMAEPTAAPAAPAAPAPGINFKAVLQEMIRRNGSDLHLKVGRPPTIRVDGELEPVEHPPHRADDLTVLAEQLLPTRQVKQVAEEKELDFAIGGPGSGRFRCNVYQQRGSRCYAMRAWYGIARMA